jgi:transposase-like protein
MLPITASNPFKWRHYQGDITLWCVRWYLSFKLSYRDLVSMMNERGICLAHTTILRWVQHYTPEFVKRWRATRAVRHRAAIPDDFGNGRARGRGASR